MHDYPITVVGSLVAAADTAALAVEGFERLSNLLSAIEHFAQLVGARQIATVAHEAQIVAEEYADNTASDREQYLKDKQETHRHA